MAELNKYIEDHSSFLCDTLDWLEKQTNLRTNYPQMICGKQKGGLLKMLTEISGGHKVLEIGSFTGYSAICIALGLSEDGKLDALEVNDELEDLIKEGWKRAGVEKKIHLHIADALGWLSGRDESEKESYDLVFIDANKREYVEYYKKIIDLVRPGGLIVTDDVLLGGKVCDTQKNHDAQTLALDAFNKTLASDNRVEAVILPLHDGLSIARKIS